MQILGISGILGRRKPRLLHIQTHTYIELPQKTSFTIGRRVGQASPDVDISGLPNASVVSRIHARIELKGKDYYIEDMKSGNGTYVRGSSLSPCQEHCLRKGDCIALGKENLVTFVFE